MTQTLYDNLQELNTEVVTIGTLLPLDFADGGNTNDDDDDLFQCGKCKKQFYSLGTFMMHKKTHQLNGFPSSQKLLTEGATSDEQDLQLQPIILSESDILSFSIGQSGLSLSSTEQGLNGFEDNEALLMPDPDDSQLKESSDITTGFQLRSTQIILTTQDSTGTDTNITLNPQPLLLPDLVPSFLRVDHQNLFPLYSISPDSSSVRFLIKGKEPAERLLLADVGGAGEPSYTLEPSILNLESDILPSTENDIETEKQKTQPEVLEKESEAKTKESKLKCPYCSKQFTKNFDLQQHIRSHTGERPFQCVVCGRSFTQKSNVKKHMATHKVWPEKIRTLPEKPLEKLTIDSAQKTVVLVNDTFACQFCTATFSNFMQLKTHLKTHADNKIFRCIQRKCGSVFETLEQFLEHTSTHQAESDVQYRCCVCRQTFTSLDDLGTHQRTICYPPPAKTKQNAVMCMVCKSKFATVEALDRHMSEDPHRYLCPECQKVYVCERHLRKHLMTHSSLATHSCQECGKKFKTAQNLNVHRLIHSGEKSYVCKLCQAAFVRQDRLARHMMMHDPSRRFKCPFHKHLGCKKEFYRKDKLKQHMMTHSAKERKCQRCSRVFKHGAQLRRHEAVCLNEDEPCKDCGHVNSSLDNYKKSTNKAKEGSHINRRKHRLLESRKSIDDGVPTIQVVVVPLQTSEVPPSL